MPTDQEWILGLPARDFLTALTYLIVNNTLLFIWKKASTTSQRNSMAAKEMLASLWGIGIFTHKTRDLKFTWLTTLEPNYVVCLQMINSGFT